MDRINQHIAKKLTDLLPENKEYYKLGELRELGFPRFVIKRMQVELERNLAESIVPPETDWANMQTDAVQNAWNQFIGAIRAEARLPASYAHTVVETAIDDIMDILIQPRKNIPEIIFGASDELSYEKVLKRVEAIVVYRHFASLIPKYMEKKGIKKLDKERCAQLIEKADKKLTEHYTPLNWAQMLEPLFNLLDEQIDSNLLRLFFEDKKMPRIARSFDLMNKSLNRAQLIEILSSPELLNVEGYDEEQSELFQEEQQPESGLEEFVKTPESETEEGDTPPDAGQQERESEPGKGDEKKADDGSSPEEEEKETDSILSRFHEGREKTGIKSREEVESFDILFEDTEMEIKEKGEKEESGEAEESASLNEIFSGEAELDTESEEDFEKSDSEESSIADDEQENELESPMWQRFMSPEELAEAEKQEREEKEEEKKEKDGGIKKEKEETEAEAETEGDDEGFVEEPIIDLTKSEGPDESEVERLMRLLEDERERFVEEIFRGADEAYEEAIRNIAGMEEWRDASKFIENEVFKRNLVDMYSESAVDFTDRLQTFYIEKNKSQS